MRSFHIKSIILGIGIGIILTSITSIIYLAGTYPEKELSDQEIIKKAEQLGMVQAVNAEDSPADSEDIKQVNKTIEAVSMEQDASLDEVTVIINKGNTSETVAERLFNAKLIDDKNEFVKKLDEMKLASKIKIGEYVIKKGASVETIIKMITNKN